MDLPPSVTWPRRHSGASDARAIVPVRDAHGGLTIYAHGRPTYYLLAGEWYPAAPSPASGGVASATPRPGPSELPRSEDPSAIADPAPARPE
jgi:hypothetical protein